jgi:Tfp pilus assembly protein PilE
MALSTTMPAGWSQANGGYTYTDPSTGQTWYGTYGDNSVLPSSTPTTAAVPALGTGGNTSWTNPGTMAAQSGIGGGLQNAIDAAVYGNTQQFALTQKQIDAQIDLANRNYQLAVNADQRAQALQDLQFWQAEQNRIVQQQNQYVDLAKTLLQAAVEKSSRPNDYYQYNKLMSGGRDIFSQVSGGAQPAFQATSGPFEPGNITDILARLGVPKFPQTTPYAGGTGGSGGASTGGAGIPGVPAPGVSGVTQAQADAVAGGLGIDPKFLYEYVHEKGSLPSMDDLNNWMNAKGYRDPNTRKLTGKMPTAGWQGAEMNRLTGADAEQARQQYGTGGPGVQGVVGGQAAVAAPPVTAGTAPAAYQRTPTTGDYEWAKAMVPANITDPATRDYFAQAIAIGRGGGGVADEFYNSTGEGQYQSYNDEKGYYE